MYRNIGNPWFSVTIKLLQRVRYFITLLHVGKPAQGQKEKGETKMKESRSVENLLNVNKRDQSRGRTPERKSTEDQGNP